MYQLNQQQLNYKSYVGLVRGMYQKPVAQTSSALILTLLTIAFFGFAAIRPTLATVSELVGELEEKREIEEKVDEKLKALALAQQRYLENQDILGVFDTVLPKDPGFTDIMFILEYIAQNNRVEITSLRQNPMTIYGQPSTQESKKALTVVGDNFGVLNYRLSVQGEVDNLAAYVQQLNNYSRYFAISQVTISQPDEDAPEEESFPTLSIEFDSYWQLDSKPSSKTKTEE